MREGSGNDEADANDEASGNDKTGRRRWRQGGLARRQAPVGKQTESRAAMCNGGVRRHEQGVQKRCITRLTD